MAKVKEKDRTMLLRKHFVFKLKFVWLFKEPEYVNSVPKNTACKSLSGFNAVSLKDSNLRWYFQGFLVSFQSCVLWLVGHCWQVQDRFAVVKYKYVFTISTSNLWSERKWKFISWLFSYLSHVNDDCYYLVWLRRCCKIAVASCVTGGISVLWVCT